VQDPTRSDPASLLAGLHATLAYERALLDRLERLRATLDAGAADGGSLTEATRWLADLLGTDPATVRLALGCDPAGVPDDPAALDG
jgi:hypothetical protein